MNMKISSLDQELGIVISTREKTSISEPERIEVANLFSSSSLILFRGFDMDTEGFKRFTESLSTNFMSYVGGGYRRKMINGDETLLSVNGSGNEEDTSMVPLHGEMYYKKKKPNLIWFYCAQPSLEGGETIICDGVQFYNHLNSYTKNLFREKQLKYTRNYPKEKWQHIYGTENLMIVENFCKENHVRLIVNPDQSITTEYVCPAIIKSRYGQHNVFINNVLSFIRQELAHGSNVSNVRFEDGTKIPESVIREIQEIANLLARPIKWQKYDVLMIDNTRLLHGRRAFYDKQRDLYVRLCDTSF